LLRRKRPQLPDPSMTALATRVFDIAVVTLIFTVLT
jgi:hypothetical protein